jgi:hypothetical protein
LTPTTHQTENVDHVQCSWRGDVGAARIAVLDSSDVLTVKRILVSSGKRLSYQRHAHREGL